MPEVALRQWVLTFPFPWRRRLAHDGKLLGALARIFVGSVARFLTKLGELTEVPARSPSRGPPYWKSTVLRRKALGEVA